MSSAAHTDSGASDDLAGTMPDAGHEASEPAPDATAAQRQDIVTARDALWRIQTGRIWFEPHSDCLDPIIEAIKALDRLAGYDNVSEASRV